MAKLSDLHNAIVKGNLELAVSTTQEALQENIDPQTLISDYLIKASTGSRVVFSRVRGTSRISICQSCANFSQTT